MTHTTGYVFTTPQVRSRSPHGPEHPFQVPSPPISDSDTKKQLDWVVIKEGEPFAGHVGVIVQNQTHNEPRNTDILPQSYEIQFPDTSTLWYARNQFDYQG